MKWIMNNFTCEMNPGLEYMELAKYYYLMAKGLKELGDYIVLDSNGVQHRWFGELFTKLKSLQTEEGYWRLESPILDTCYIILALVEEYPNQLPIPGLEFRMGGRRSRG
jgi:hypothetical protein